jgi:Dolichyl-phosphate-mannose-protein mannosyltransferase
MIAAGLAVVALWQSSTLLSLLTPLLAAVAFVPYDWPKPVACRGRRLLCEWRASDCSGLAGILAIASLVLMVAICALTWHDTPSKIGTLLWPLSLVLVVAAAARLDGATVRSLRVLRPTRARIEAFISHPEVMSVIAITVVGFVLRIYDLDAYPPQFHGDEAEMGVLAVDIMRGDRPSIFTVAPYWGSSYLLNYLQAVGMDVFGADVAGVRTLSVILGTACIPMIYVTARLGWGPVAGAVAAWLMAVSAFHIHYSRMAQIFIYSCVLMVTMMMVLAMAYERGGRGLRPRDDAAAITTGPPLGRPGIWTLLVLAGIFAGLSQYFYHASRVVPLVAAPLLLVLWRSRRATFVQIAAFGFGALIVYLPLAMHHLYHPDLFYGRFQTVSAFSPQYIQQILGPDATLPRVLPMLMYEQFWRILRMFVRSGDYSGFYTSSVPAFDAVTACLMWLGMGAALARIRRFHELAVLLWFWLGIIFGGVFTIDAPSGQRLLIMVPSVYVFGGLLVARALKLFRTTPVMRANWLAVPVGTGAALILLALNVTIYFMDYAPLAVGIQATVVAREIDRDPEQYHAYLLTDPVFYPGHGTLKFIARDVQPENLKTAADFKPPPPDGRGIVIVALDHRIQELRAIEARLPGGTESTYLNPQGRLVYIAYRVPPATTAASP